jgi:hypothetical protein
MEREFISAIATSRQLWEAKFDTSSSLALSGSRVSFFRFLGHIIGLIAMWLMVNDSNYSLLAMDDKLVSILPYLSLGCKNE